MRDSTVWAQKIMTSSLFNRLIGVISWYGFDYESQSGNDATKS